MTLRTFHVHSVHTIHARASKHPDGNWIDIFVNGEDEEILTLFFTSKTLATSVADAINIAAGHATPAELATESLVEAGITEPVPSPIEGVQMFQFKDEA